MAENNPHLPETPGNGPGHETGDVNVWAIGKFAIALVGIIAVSLMLLVGLFKYFQTRDGANPTAVSVDPTKLFPEPRLERTPIPDLSAIRVEEDRMLNSYGWVDPQKNVVRVPIDVAIDILARKGLPTRPQPSRDRQDASRDRQDPSRDRQDPSRDRQGAEAPKP